MDLGIKDLVWQLLEFMENITSILDEGEDVNILYLDFKWGFDFIMYERFLSCIKDY